MGAEWGKEESTMYSEGAQEGWKFRTHGEGLNDPMASGEETDRFKREGEVPL